MAQPANATVSIDGTKFNAMSAHVGIETDHDDTGIPQMGTLRCSISCTVDIHDTVNMPFSTLQQLYNMANVVTLDKVKPIKVEFWQDENQLEAICSYSFKGWISAFHTDGGGGANHILHLKLQPTLNTMNYVDLTIGN
jgi:hypothetical protein